MRVAHWLLALSLFGCRVSLDVDDEAFPCNNDGDCAAGYECINDVCKEPGSGAANDPCRNVTCPNPLEACREFDDGAACGPCDLPGAECQAGYACVANGATAECRATCLNGSGCILEGGGEGTCADVAGLQPPITQSVCVPCPVCDGAVCLPRNGVSTTLDDAAYCDLSGEDCSLPGNNADGDGAPACLDRDCVIGPPSCDDSAPEACGNNFDDDHDGACDCFDAECGGFTACQGWFAPSGQVLVSAATGPDGARQPSVAIDGLGRPWVGWTDGGTPHVRYFDPTGCSWKSAVGSGADMIATLSADARSIVLAGSASDESDSIRAVWIENQDGGQDQVYGTILSDQTNGLPPAPFGTGSRTGPGISASGGDVRQMHLDILDNVSFVTWATDGGVFGKRLDGANWSELQNSALAGIHSGVTGSIYTSPPGTRPHVAVGPDRIAVVWTHAANPTSPYMRWSISGAAWQGAGGSDSNDGLNTTPDAWTEPDIAMGPSDTYVASRDVGTNRVKLRRMRHGDVVWTPVNSTTAGSDEISGAGQAFSADVLLTDGGGHGSPMVVYMSRPNTGSQTQILASRFHPNAWSLFSPDYAAGGISNALGARQPAADRGGPLVCVTWEQDDDNPDSGGPSQIGLRCRILTP